MCVYELCVCVCVDASPLSSLTSACDEMLTSSHNSCSGRTHIIRPSSPRRDTSLWFQRLSLRHPSSLSPDCPFAATSPSLTLSHYKFMSTCLKTSGCVGSVAALFAHTCRRVSVEVGITHGANSPARSKTEPRAPRPRPPS